MKINWLGFAAYMSVCAIEMIMWKKFSPETYGTFVEWAFFMVLMICASVILRPWERVDGE